MRRVAYLGCVRSRVTCAERGLVGVKTVYRANKRDCADRMLWIRCSRLDRGALSTE
jgi:hypothetical protein